MALTKDIQTRTVGARKDPIAAPLPTGVTVYQGSIALLDSSKLLKNAASPTSADTCIGIFGPPTGGSNVPTGPGIVGAGTTQAGYVYVDVQTGSFLLAMGTGSDALTEADAGNTVFVVDEQTVGKTNGSNTRPAAGVMLPLEPTTPTGFVAVKMNTIGGTGP